MKNIEESIHSIYSWSRCIMKHYIHLACSSLSLVAIQVVLGLYIVRGDNMCASDTFIPLCLARAFARRAQSWHTIRAGASARALHAATTSSMPSRPRTYGGCTMLLGPWQGKFVTRVQPPQLGPNWIAQTGRARRYRQPRSRPEGNDEATEELQSDQAVLSLRDQAQGERAQDQRT